MKRDMDLVREILLAVEAADENTPGMDDLLGGDQSETEIDTREKYAYHIKMLVEQAGLLTGIDASSMSGGNWLNLEVTWQGHDFLDNTRDSEVWRMTKSGLQKMGGAGWDVVKALAVAYAKQKAQQVLGVHLS